MKTEKLAEITFQKVVEVRTVCDLCGAETTRGWRRDEFDATDVEVRLKQGSSYPDGGSGTEIEIDLCPDCFRDRLVPWIRSSGGKVEEREWDW